MNRRQLLGGTALVALAFLTGCASNGTIDQQILADGQGLVATVSAMIAAVEKLSPTALSATVQNDLGIVETVAQSALSSLAQDTTLSSSTATDLQKVDAFLKEGLSAVQPILPLVPGLATYIPLYDAAVALLPIVEAYIGSVTGKAAAALPFTPIHAAYTVGQARNMLHIVTVTGDATKR